MKMVKGLTKTNIRGTGIEVAPQYDFTDDGNRFRGFIYKGMPMTQCRADGICYLTIRTDELDNRFTLKEWMATEEFALEDEFNGVSEFDLDKLIQNLEAVIAKVNELNANAEEVDVTAIVAKANEEIESAEEFVEHVKATFKWWEKDEYTVRKITHYFKEFTARIERLRKKDFASLSRKNQKYYAERLEQYGYIELTEDDFYRTQIAECL